VGEQRQSVACPEYDCRGVLEDHFVLQLVSTDAKLINAYRKRMCEGYVVSNSALQACPAPDCQHAVRCGERGAAVRCACGAHFCHACAGPPHRPVPCLLLRYWLRKSESDTATSRYLKLNTKDCPKCHSTIEKDHGCHHMTCKKCSHHFCWQCLGDWKSYGHQRECNFFESDQTKAKHDMARKQLAKYVFHYERYFNHMNSLKLEGKLKQTVAASIEKLVESSNAERSWVQTKFMDCALSTLVACRRTLMSTYVFAYYAAACADVAIFRDNQADLEGATEQLSGFLEHDIPPGTDISTFRAAVEKKYRYCETRRRKLIEHLLEGTEKGVWVYDTSQ